MVLLKNEGDLLPLGKDIASIAVIGPNADELQSLLGNYHGTPANYSTPLAGIRKKLSPQTKLFYAQGCAMANGLPPLRIIPTEALCPAVKESGEHGLSAAYFDNPSFTGEPVIERIDATVDAVWIDTTPFNGKWGESFSIRWTGSLIPPVSGRYRIGVSGFSGYDLYLNDELIATYQDVHHPRIKTTDLELEAGRPYNIRLDYVNTGLDPQVQLLWAIPGTDYAAEALEAAEKADVIIAVMGLSPNLEGEELPISIEGFSGGDRTDINLPAPQEALLKHLHALGKPIVLVLLNGSALAVSWAADNIPAIVEAWYPGQAGGDALADVLFGDYNPGGKLPVTFYQSVDDLPPFEDYQMVGRTYRYFQGKPLFPFGYGLSYTTFQFENLDIDKTEAAAGEAISISIEVTNCGDIAGDEVVQLYTRQFAAPPRPVKELKGFKRISLQPGERKRVRFTLFVNQLGVYDAELLSAVHPGKVEVMVGNSSACLPLSGSFEIVGEPVDVRSDKVFFSQVQVTRV
jgi:beta-glucosidase